MINKIAIFFILCGISYSQMSVDVVRNDVIIKVDGSKINSDEFSLKIYSNNECCRGVNILNDGSIDETIFTLPLGNYRAVLRVGETIIQWLVFVIK